MPDVIQLKIKLLEYMYITVKGNPHTNKHFVQHIFKLKLCGSLFVGYTICTYSSGMFL